MSRAPSRRALLAGAGAAAVAPVATVSAMPAPRPTAPDPAVVAWRGMQRAYRFWMAAAERADVIPSDPALDVADQAAFGDWEAAMAQLVAARPTTVRGVLAKVAAARAEVECYPDIVTDLLAGLQSINPDTLTAG